MEKQKIKDLYQKLAQDHLRKLVDQAKAIHRYVKTDPEKTLQAYDQVTNIISNMMKDKTYLRLVEQHPSLASLTWNLATNRQLLVTSIEFNNAPKDWQSAMIAKQCITDANLVLAYCATVTSDALGNDLLTEAECRRLGEILGIDWSDTASKQSTPNKNDDQDAATSATPDVHQTSDRSTNDSQTAAASTESEKSHSADDQDDAEQKQTEVQSKQSN